MQTQPQTLVTAEQFYQLPEEQGRGLEARATPRHNLVVGRLTAIIFNGLRGRGAALPCTYFSGGRGTSLRPDLAILVGEKFAGLDLDNLRVTVPPDIAVEVVASCDTATWVQKRIAAYLRLGVQEVWIVFPQSFYVHTEAGVKRHRSGDTLQSPLLPDWSMAVDQLFE